MTLTKAELSDQLFAELGLVPLYSPRETLPAPAPNFFTQNVCAE